MNVKNAAIPNPVVVNRHESIHALIQKLLAGDQEVAAVVLPDGRLEGVVGFHDIMKATVPWSVMVKENLRSLLHDGYFAEHYATLLNKTVDQVMRPDVDAVKPDDTLFSAVALFVSKNRRALPVVANGFFLGMVTRTSILKRLAQLSGGKFPG